MSSLKISWLEKYKRKSNCVGWDTAVLDFVVCSEHVSQEDLSFAKRIHMSRKSALCEMRNEKWIAKWENFESSLAWHFRLKNTFIVTIKLKLKALHLNFSFRKVLIFGSCGFVSQSLSPPEKRVQSKQMSDNSPPGQLAPDYSPPNFRQLAPNCFDNRFVIAPLPSWHNDEN